MIDAFGRGLGWFVAQGGGIDVDVSLGEGVLGSAGSAFLGTILVGAILVAVLPDYTERMMAAVLDDPVGSFLYGLAAVLAVVVLTVALVVSLVGIPVLLVLAPVVAIVVIAGDAIAFLAIADRLVDSDDGWLVPLVVAGTLNGGLVLTGVGGIVAAVIGIAGFGAVVSDALQ